MPGAARIANRREVGLWIGSHMFGLCYVLIAVSAFLSLPIFDGLLR